MTDYLYLNSLHVKIKEEITTFVINHPTIFTDENIELFIKILILPLDNPTIRLEGLQTRVLNALAKIFLEDLNKADRSSFFPEFAKIEPFLQKIVYLVDPNEYYAITSSRAGLSRCIDFLGLNYHNIKLSNSTVESVQSFSHFTANILRSYQLRNLESHKCLEWSNKELYENIESVLITYIYTVHLHAPLLKTKIAAEPDFTAYLENVVKEFETWQKRFVHITGQERFDEISIHAVESEEWNGAKAFLREGSIDDIRKNLEENTMVVLGEPGMGKSTTMQHLAYNDAKDLLSLGVKDLSRIPVYLELKLLSKTDSIALMAAEKLGVTKDKLLEYFLKGKITLLLDGLNEVFSEMRKPIRSEIQVLMEKFNNLFVIVTSRPLAYSNEFKATPVFVLQRMEDHQVEEFLEKNCQHKPTEDIIKVEFKANVRLGKIVRVPLLLKMLITVVRNNRGLMPVNKTQIIKEFIHNIYERERAKDIIDIDFRIIHRLLCFLAHRTREMNGSNVGWRSEELESVIERRIEKSRYKINAFQFIDMAVDLNLLVKDGFKYSFIHELYQEYFASEEIFRLKSVAND